MKNHSAFIENWYWQKIDELQNDLNQWRQLYWNLRREHRLCDLGYGSDDVGYSSDEDDI